MKERRDILALARQSPHGVLISLVRVSMLPKREPVARLFVALEGTTAGAITRGCLDANLINHAIWMVERGAVIMRYDVPSDNPSETQFGLGCGGDIDLLLEDVSSAEGKALLAAIESSLSGDERFVATRLPLGVNCAPCGAGRSDHLARIVLNADGDLLFATERLGLDEIIAMRGILRRAMVAHEIHCTVINGIFCERFAPCSVL